MIASLIRASGSAILRLTATEAAGAAAAGVAAGAAGYVLGRRSSGPRFRGTRDVFLGSLPKKERSDVIKLTATDMFADVIANFSEEKGGVLATVGFTKALAAFRTAHGPATFNMALFVMALNPQVAFEEMPKAPTCTDIEKAVYRDINQNVGKPDRAALLLLVPHNSKGEITAPMFDAWVDVMGRCFADGHEVKSIKVDPSWENRRDSDDSDSVRS